MRTLASVLGLGLGCGLLATTGCKWTDFDDLKADTWITVTSKPNSDSTDYAVALARGTRTSASGGKLVVLGAGQAQYTELVYASDGDADLAPTALKLNTQFGIGNLDLQPLLLADPASDEVSLVLNAGNQSIAVLHGEGGLIAHQIFGPSQPDTAAYMLPPMRADNVGGPPTSAPLVAAGDSVYGSFFTATPQGSMAPRCKLADENGMPVLVRALGPIRYGANTFDDVVAWVSTSTMPAAGRLMIYPGSIFLGSAPTGTCDDATPVRPLSVPVDTTFAPGIGSSIVMLDNKYALLVGHKEPGTTDSYLGFFDVTAMNAMPKLEPARIGPPNTEPNLRTATVLDLGAQKYVVAGYPNTIVDGSKNAGQVKAYGLDLATGISITAAMTLHDAQPESDQAYGRALAVTQFNGKPVLAVAADNEVFTYFRTTLYDETRQ